MSDISLLTDYGKQLLDSTKQSATASSMKNSVDSVTKDSTEAEMLDACKQFESYLWEQIYKEIDKSVNLFGTNPDESNYASNMVNAFSDTVIKEVAERTTSEGSNSLAMMLFEQLKRNNGIGTATPTDAELSEQAAEAGVVENQE